MVNLPRDLCVSLCVCHVLVCFSVGVRAVAVVAADGFVVVHTQCAT